MPRVLRRLSFIQEYLPRSTPVHRSFRARRVFVCLRTYEHTDLIVTGIFLLRKFHLGKFHLDNSSYGKFLLWKKTM